MILYKLSLSEEAEKNLVNKTLAREHSFAVKNFLVKILNSGYVILDADESKLEDLRVLYNKDEELFQVSFKAFNAGITTDEIVNKILGKGYNLQKANAICEGLMNGLDLSEIVDMTQLCTQVVIFAEDVKKVKGFDKRKKFNVFYIRDRFAELNADCYVNIWDFVEKGVYYLIRNRKEAFDAYVDSIKNVKEDSR